MVRLSTLFIAVCAAVIAASLGALAYLALGMTLAEACMVGLTALMALTGLALYGAISGARRERRELAVEIAGQVSDLARGMGDLARQVTDHVGRLAALENGHGPGAAEIAAAIKPIQGEIVELGSLVQQLAEASVAHDAALRDPFSAHRAAAIQNALPAAAPDDKADLPAVAETDQPAVVQPESDVWDLPDEPEEDADPEIVVGGAFHGKRRDEVIALIREAIDDHRIDLFLQPTVTLPQRKVRFYEAVMRLRMPDGTLLAAADFLDFAESGGLMPAIDLSMVLRCARVARRLMSKNRDIALFCNLSAATLADATTFAQLREYLEANRALANVLIFEMQHDVLREVGELEGDRLAALTADGFRLSVDHVTDLQFEWHLLAAKGCRFVKIPAELLLAPGDVAGDIDPTDLPGLLRRFGIELIAEKIEQESTVVDLLDFDIKFAQGYLFSPPRPVRPEVMQAEPVAVPLPAPAAAASEPAPRLRTSAERPAAVAERISALTQMARRVARNAS